MKRAQSIKKRWKMHRRCQDLTGHSEYNFGRMPLEWYLKDCYKSYKNLCHSTGETAKERMKWLCEDV